MYTSYREKLSNQLASPEALRLLFLSQVPPSKALHAGAVWANLFGCCFLWVIEGTTTSEAKSHGSPSGVKHVFSCLSLFGEGVPI